MEIVVKKGDWVRAGDIIAYALKGEMGSISLHFQVQEAIKEKAVCPYIYFNEKAKAEFNELFANADYEGKASYPLICNECPKGGCY
jgi:murein DD-endopeptidase MepM/ murein hydrolase activator NlpD